LDRANLFKFNHEQFGQFSTNSRGQQLGIRKTVSGTLTNHSSEVWIFISCLWVSAQ